MALVCSLNPARECDGCMDCTADPDRILTIAAYDALVIKAGRPGKKDEAQNVTYE